MSHHSSPTSYAGSVAGSAAGICANNSLPVGASACSIARAEQELLEGSAASAAGGGGSVLGGQRSSKHGSGAGGGGGGKKGKSSHHKKTAAMSVASSSVSVAQVGSYQYILTTCNDDFCLPRGRPRKVSFFR